MTTRRVAVECDPTAANTFTDPQFMKSAKRGADAFNSYFGEETGASITLNLKDDGYDLSMKKMCGKTLYEIWEKMVALRDGEDAKYNMSEEDIAFELAADDVGACAKLLLMVSQSKYKGLIKSMDDILRTFWTGVRGGRSEVRSSTTGFAITHTSAVGRYTRKMIETTTSILCSDKERTERCLSEVKPIFAELLEEASDTGEKRICANEGDYLEYAELVKRMYESNEEFMRDAIACKWWDGDFTVGDVRAEEGVPREVIPL